MLKFESPLKWLPQQPRTKNPERARFGTHSISRSADLIINELEKLGAKYFVISSNLQVRLKGDGFLANQKIVDTGIVVYFELKGKGKAMACDRWDKVEHNLWAIYTSLYAIRGLERWGGSAFLDGLFAGFKALPAPGDFLGDYNFFKGINSLEEFNKRYRELSRELHPDKLGGNSEQWHLMQEEYSKLAKVFGGKS